MQMAGRDRDSSPRTVEESTEEGPALRDASLVAERAMADAGAARDARNRLRTSPLPAIEADEIIAPHLLPSEIVHGVRSRAILRAPGGDEALGYGGTLYLTSRRLVHVGQVIVTVQLTDIMESSLAGERILLSLRGGEGLTLDVDRPRVLRAEMAAATRRLRT